MEISLIAEWNIVSWFADICALADAFIAYPYVFFFLSNRATLLYFFLQCFVTLDYYFETLRRFWHFITELLDRKSVV